MKNIKIFVAGHRGLVGSAIHRVLQEKGYANIITRSRQELDLFNYQSVMDFFEREKPDWVFLAAAKVGGIYANDTYPADFLLENLKIQNNVIEACYKYNTKKLLFLGSSCIYPKFAKQPLTEDSLLTSSLEPTNEAYAIAKIAGIKLCKFMNKQYGSNFISVMPTNMYGKNDNYHLENAHVLPMLLRRFHEAKVSKSPVVTVWGTGTPRREFMFVDELADACIYLMEKYDAKDIGELVNIGTGKDCTIKELAEMIKDVVGYTGEIEYDTSKPDGTPQKLLDVSRLEKLGWKSKIGLFEGIKLTYNDFLTNKNLRK